MCTCFGNNFRIFSTRKIRYPSLSTLETRAHRPSWEPVRERSLELVLLVVPLHSCHLHHFTLLKMTRGNQRELARQKNQKKQQELSKKKAADEKGANKGQTLEERRLRDAEVMRIKQKKAEEKAAQEAAAAARKK